MHAHGHSLDLYTHAVLHIAINMKPFWRCDSDRRRQKFCKTEYKRSNYHFHVRPPFPPISKLCGKSDLNTHKRHQQKLEAPRDQHCTTLKLGGRGEGRGAHQENRQLQIPKQIVMSCKIFTVHSPIGHLFCIRRSPQVMIPIVVIAKSLQVLKLFGVP